MEGLSTDGETAGKGWIGMLIDLLIKELLCGDCMEHKIRRSNMAVL